jgi:acetoin utilization protein AcuB
LELIMTAETTTTEPVLHPSHPVLAISPDADAITALGVMSDQGVRHLPVVRGNRCEGLVIEADLLRAITVAASSQPPTVGMLYRRYPPTVAKDADLPTVAAAILGGGLDAALVVHGCALVGIVTSIDVLAAIAERRGRAESLKEPNGHPTR